MSKNDKSKDEFNAPQLPFGWIGATLLLPSLVTVLPPIITNSYIMLERRIIAGLVVAATIMFIYALSTFLQTYKQANIQAK